MLRKIVSGFVFIVSLSVLASCQMLYLSVGTAEAGCAKDSSGHRSCGPGTCVTDSLGEVWCSKYHQGGAALTEIGTVHCGRGGCSVGEFNSIRCSPVVGGGSWVNEIGSIVCSNVEGERIPCESGSVNYCQRGE